MKLTEDELDDVAAAYHTACERALQDKLDLYAAAGRTPTLGALRPGPMDWADAVATEVEAIIIRRNVGHLTVAMTHDNEEKS